MGKHWLLKFKDKKPPEEIQTSVGKLGGLLTRIHFEKGETHVYFVGEESMRGKATQLLKPISLTEVTINEVTRFT